MGSEDNEFEALLIGNNLQTWSSNSVVLDDILVNRSGAYEPMIENTCNQGYVIQCYIDNIQENKCSSDPFMFLFIAVVAICLMLVLGLIYLFKKKRALEKECDALIHKMMPQLSYISGDRY